MEVYTPKIIDTRVPIPVDGVQISIPIFQKTVFFLQFFVEFGVITEGQTSVGNYLQDIQSLVTVWVPGTRPVERNNICHVRQIEKS